jgi:hypothetical protein
VNTRASLGFPQDTREVPLATGRPQERAARLIDATNDHHILQRCRDKMVNRIACLGVHLVNPESGQVVGNDNDE